MAPFYTLQFCEHILKAQFLVRKHKNMSGNVLYMYKYLLNNTLCDTFNVRLTAIWFIHRLRNTYNYVLIERQHTHSVKFKLCETPQTVHCEMCVTG